MKSFIELLDKVLGPRRKPKHVCDEELYSNVNGCLDPNCPVKRTRKPLPSVPPPGPPPTPSEQLALKKKSRIIELEQEVKGLKEQFTEQTELLERLVRELSTLRRDVVHLLPEK